MKKAILVLLSCCAPLLAGAWGEGPHKAITQAALAALN